MKIRTDADKIRSFIISDHSETNHYEEMMKSFFRTEKAKIPIADYTGVTIEQWLPKRRAILKKLAAAVGPFPDRKVPLKAKTNAKYDRGDYTIEGVSFYTRPNWPVSALLSSTAIRSSRKPSQPTRRSPSTSPRTGTRCWQSILSAAVNANPRGTKTSLCTPPV
jgi:hypothetical protein